MLISICRHPHNQEVFTKVPLLSVQHYGTKQVAADQVEEIVKRRLLVHFSLNLGKTTVAKIESSCSKIL